MAAASEGRRRSMDAANGSAARATSASEPANEAGTSASAVKQVKVEAQHDDPDHTMAEDGADSSAQAPPAPPPKDVISQLESDLALVLRIMSSSLHHLTNRSAHVQLNADIPLFQPISSASLNSVKNLIDQERMNEHIEELSDDLIGKAKDMERLLDWLPRQRDEDVVKEELRELNEQMTEANAEYREALEETKKLRLEMNDLLRTLCDDHQHVRAQLAAAATEGSTYPRKEAEGTTETDASAVL